MTLASSSYSSTAAALKVEVDVIVPVHNAAATLRETLQSALRQVWPCRGRCSKADDSHDAGDDESYRYITSSSVAQVEVVIYVCCYNDASTDESWYILQELQKLHNDSSRGSASRSEQRQHANK
jgi:glycosyltransferase involved in cell wall biosynthesis